jgi:4-hydroxymandelate oxidase
VDVPWLGHREDDLRNRFVPPPGVVPKNLIGLVDIAAAFAGAAASPISPTQSAFSDPALTWADVDWLRSLTSLPLLLKGILTAEDALLALEHGVDGIIVSNHGGRQLDGAVSSIEALPEVVEAVAGRAEVLLDSGVRRGTDVLKALALGAKAVLIGRPYIWGLAVDGEAGVRRVLSLLREEFALAMALAGCRTVAEIDRSRVRLGGE